MTTMLTITPNAPYSMDITEPVEPAPEHESKLVLSKGSKILVYSIAMIAVFFGIPMEIFYFWNQANLWGYWGTELTGWAIQHAAYWVIGFTALAGAVRFIQRKAGE